MLFGKRISNWLGIAVLCLPFISFAAIPIKSIVIFGDSLSDTGNTTHLLKSLHNDEDPSFFVEPFKAFVVNKMEDFAEEYYIPQLILDAGLIIVHDFFDHKLAPMLTSIITKIKDIPILPGEPYWQSRFSNGPVWIEYLAPMVGINADDSFRFTNRAFAGSWAATYDYQLNVWNLIRHPYGSLKNLVVGKLIPPSLGLSVQAYLMNNKSLNKNTAYFVFAGGNDYLNILQFDEDMDDETISDYVDNVIDNLGYSIEKLTKAGAKHFIIIGLPHIGDSPKFNRTAQKEILNTTTDIHNSRLHTQMTEWQDLYPEVKFVFLDTVSTLDLLKIDPTAYGFNNTEDACIDVKIPLIHALASSPFAKNYVLNYAHTLQYKNPQFADEKNYHVCDTPETYLFWDEVHPSTRTHHLMAASACESLKMEGYAVECSKPEI